MNKTMGEFTREEINKIKIASSRNILRLLEICKVPYSDHGTVLKSCCPAKNHAGDRDNTGAFCWWVDSGSWICFSHNCQTTYGSDVIGLTRAIFDISFTQAVEALNRFVKNKLELSLEDISDEEIKQHRVKTNNYKIHANRLKFLQNDENSLKYLLDRGFSIDVLKKYDVGYWAKLGTYMDRRIVIPVRDYDGAIVGFTGRSIWPEEELTRRREKKWKHGIDYVTYKKDSFFTNAIVFNLNNAKKYNDIILVEGILDGFKLSMAGYDNWVAILGSHFSTQQISLLCRAGIARIYLMLDGDKAGREASQKIKKMLSDYFEVTDVELPENKDPGDLQVEQIKELIQNAEN